MSESGIFFRFFEVEKSYNSAAPAAGFRHLCTSMTVFVNFSTWAIFFEGGGRLHINIYIRHEGLLRIRTKNLLFSAILPTMTIFRPYGNSQGSLSRR